MPRNKTVSVIVPVYKVEEYLPRCVDSILRQTYEDLEIILVDDGSPDASGAICDDYAARDSRVRVIHKPNGGLSSARNAGIDAATGDYLGFVDSDDWIGPDMYETMMGLMKQHHADLVCGGRYNVDGGTGEKTPGLCPKQEECITGEEMAGRIFLWDGCDSSVCDKLFHRSLFETFRFPEGMVSEDVATTYKIVLKAGTVVMCPKPFYHYFHRSGSISMETVITEKTFHFSRHTALIYDYIRENHPSIVPQARYLRVRSLAHILLLLEQAAPQVRQQFRQQYRFARQQLRSHTGFLLRSPNFGTKERITNLLLVLNLYRLLRPIFHRESETL